MLLVGVTGGIACGKSAVVTILRQHSVSVVDCDEIAHDVAKKVRSCLSHLEIALLLPNTLHHVQGHWGYRRMVKAFGSSILQKNGEIDRKALGQHVFSDPVARKKLNKATHLPVFASLIRQIIWHWLKGTLTLVVDMPLLFETGSHRFFNSAVLVDCSNEQQVQRLTQRDKCSKEEAENKIAAQMPLEQKRRLAQYTINNSGSLQDTDAQVRQLLKVLKRRNRWRMWLTSPHASILNPIARLFRRDR